METAGLVLSAAQTLFTALKRSDVKELFSLFGYKSELEKLERTVSRVKSVLKDTEAKQVLYEQEKDLVEKLRDAVYDADDLLDEFLTVAEQEKLRLTKEDGGFTKKVRSLFHRFETLLVAHTMSRELKKIRRSLDEIAQDAHNFRIEVDDRPLRKRREETCSYVYESEIIGREEDTERILELLLADSDGSKDNVSFLTLVGIGGLGKTTLAQLIYNNISVKNKFKLRLWACISDQDHKNLDIQAILTKILESALCKKCDSSNMEIVQQQLEDHLKGNKYFLVLDDVWTEDHNEWLKLKNYLMRGVKGSRVLVTTRSKNTAKVVGDTTPYELEGLAPTYSWMLFKRIAFGKSEEQSDPNELVEIGKQIVGKCANVPLAIRVVGSLLYGQEKRKWVSFQQSGLSEILQGGNEIILILKFSYHHLPPSLKSCFSYCAIFPKDFIIRKDLIISLWIALGYIMPLDEKQSIEDAAEEHFAILLRRCFFQDVVKDKWGEIISFKIHDLMHDVAQQVAGKEFLILNSPMSYVNKKVRHVFNASFKCAKNVFTKAKIRTYLQEGITYQQEDTEFPIKALLANFMCLRVLDLSRMHLSNVPCTIGKLLHLRFLNLSWNDELEVLPNCITKLHNLQTLLLKGCINLKELPNAMNKLINLRVLDMEGCIGLNHMPFDMGKLTNLGQLSTFVLARKNSNLKQPIGKIGDLRAFRNLKCHLKIFIKKDYRYDNEEGRRGGYISNKEDLTKIDIEWEDRRGEPRQEGYRVEAEEALLEDLEPPCKLRELELNGYLDVRIPRWAREDNLSTSLPNLVEMELKRCAVKELPWLSKLRFLKHLVLESLWNLEHMEDISNLRAGGSSSSGLSFFPSLEELHLKDLPKFKQWWRVLGHDHLVVNLSLPRLSHLYVTECPNLTSLPCCPTLQRLDMFNLDQKLQFVIKEKEMHEKICQEEKVPKPVLLFSKNRRLSSVFMENIDHFKHLKALSYHQLGVGELAIRGYNNKESLQQDHVEVFQSLSLSLGILEISECDKLRTLGELKHLTALEWLGLSNNPNLTLDQEEDECMMWRSFGKSLRAFAIRGSKMVKNLPKGMRYLTSLQYLYIEDCPLKGLPDWINCFSSLQTVKIRNCRLESLPEEMQELASLQRLEISKCLPILKERCQKPDGEDWLKIQHVPDVYIW